MKYLFFYYIFVYIFNLGVKQWSVSSQVQCVYIPGKNCEAEGEIKFSPVYRHIILLLAFESHSLNLFELGWAVRRTVSGRLKLVGLSMMIITARSRARIEQP